MKGEDKSKRPSRVSLPVQFLWLAVAATSFSPRLSDAFLPPTTRPAALSATHAKTNNNKASSRRILMVSAASNRGTSGSNKGNEKVKIAAAANAKSVAAAGASHQPPTSTTPSTTIEPPGLGGRSGIRPDVNNLKRNLVQEAVRAYKSELLELLGTPSSVGDKRIQINASVSDSSGGTNDNVGSNGGASSDAASSAASSALYGNGSAAVTEYDETKDGGKPVAYYKYGPGSALTGRTYAGEWATRDDLIEDKLAALVQVNPRFSLVVLLSYLLVNTGTNIDNSSHFMHVLFQLSCRRTQYQRRPIPTYSRDSGNLSFPLTVRLILSIRHDLF